jgi:UDP-N-acetylglucosamine--N-acetylmuramyl-(pentapeptide) pyrophosphoryl-undecaprenol N-acetylglucosamine transferase
MKVIIAGGGTGGHLFPAVALGEEIVRQRPSADVLFVGSSTGFEAQWLPRSGLKHRLFKMRGIMGHSFLDRMKALGEFTRALRQSMTLLSEFHPDVVVSAGGYASAPVAVAAILRRVPLMLMEQNTRPGFSNRMLWRFAKKVCVGFEDAAAFFDMHKVEVTGNPLRVIPKPGYPQPVNNSIRILVLGGSSGAHSLNLGILDAFKRIDKTVIKLSVVHQTGDADEGLVRDSYRDIGVDAQVVPFINDMASALYQANLVVARAGAMTVSEIAVAARPAVFVPYPFHRDRQQEFNAKVVVRLGGAVVVRDDEHLGENLKVAIEKLIRDRAGLEEMGRRANRAGKPDAAARIARLCFEIAETGRQAA